MTATRRTAVLGIAALGLFASCSAGMSRQQIVDGYRRELVRSGVPDALAACVTDKLFAGMDDDALRAFQRRDRLTDDEKARTAQYAQDCGAGAAGG